MNVKKIILSIYFISLSLLILILNLKADSLNINIYTCSNNAPASNISFGIITNEASRIAEQFVKITYSVSNKYDWIIQLYTDNTNSTSVSGQYNGLIGINNKSLRIPLLWQVYSNTNSTITLTTNNDSYWGKIKDLRDIDWNKADINTIIASNNILGGFPAIGRNIETTNIYIYIGAHFYNCSDDIFKTALHIDLLPNIIKTTPGITYEPIEKINILGNKIIIYSDISDDSPIETVKFAYRTIGDTIFTEIVYHPDSKYYRLKAEIPAASVTSGGIEYYIRAENSEHTTNSGTNIIEFVDKCSDTVSVKGRTIILKDGNPEDGETSLEIFPSALSQQQSITFNQLYKTEDIIPGNSFVSGQTPIMLFNITPKINFNISAKLKLLYLDLNNTGKPETVSGAETSIDENELAVCWWDGFEWRYIGGTVDTVKNTVTVNISHTGVFGLFSVKSLTADNFRPKERIVTPNGDGINDTVFFDGISDNIKIKIFNLKGNRITELSTPVWDCRDSDGNKVESGVYIYQLSVNLNGEQKIISGTIVIVK